ncbi:MAG: PqqD family protein [Candidatus Eremiobacteraeota bacterium]|nr:PqqD family protein [Candidatus Eremiobacteraeota bacterium]
MYDRCQELEFRKVGDETIVHDKTNEKIHVVNQTAADILEFCSKKSTAELADFMRGRYDIGNTDVEEDVREILDVFVEKGLVQRIPA